MATVLESLEAEVDLESQTPAPSSVLPLPPSRKPYLFTAEQALKMAKAGIFEGEGSVELWDGVFYKMTKYEPHNCVVLAVCRALQKVVPSDYMVREEKSCSADALSIPEPDVMVYKGGLWDHFNGPPPSLAKMELLVEVNYSTPEDYTIKLAKYTKAGVLAYWVVDVNARNFAVFTKPQANIGRYGESKTFARGEEIAVVLGGETVGAIKVSDCFPPDEETPALEP